jgi:hypothetical protein
MECSRFFHHGPLLIVRHSAAQALDLHCKRFRRLEGTVERISPKTLLANILTPIELYCQGTENGRCFWGCCSWQIHSGNNHIPNHRRDGFRYSKMVSWSALLSRGAKLYNLSARITCAGQHFCRNHLEKICRNERVRPLSRSRKSVVRCPDSADFSPQGCWTAKRGGGILQGRCPVRHLWQRSANRAGPEAGAWGKWRLSHE